MRYWNQFVRAVQVAGAICAIGCGAVGGDDGADLEGGIEFDSIDSEIRDGTQGGGVGAVEISSAAGTCTGTLIGGSMVLTASHCFPQVEPWTATFLPGRVSYAITGTSWKCLMINGPSTGKCTSDGTLIVQRLPGGHAGRDLAVVTQPVPFSKVAAGDPAQGFYTGNLPVGQQYREYGRGYFHYNGTGSGVMRYMDDTLDWVGSEYVITDAGGKRICFGDSGGPYFNPGGGTWMFGILSEMDSASGECATVGTKVRATRLTVTRKNQINDFRAVVGLPACTQLPGHSDYWTCS